MKITKNSEREEPRKENHDSGPDRTENVKLGVDMESERLTL